MAGKSLTVVLERIGKTATVFRVPFDLRKAFGRARPPVRVTMHGHTRRTARGVYRGVGHVVGNHAVMAATGVGAGGRVRLRTELDTDPGEVRLPPELQAALAGHRAARAENRAR